MPLRQHPQDAAGSFPTGATWAFVAMGLKVTESPAQSFAYVEALSCIGVGLEVFVNYHRTKLHGRILVCACKCSQIRELYQYVTTRSPKVSFQRCCSAGSSEFQRTAFV